MHGHSGHNFTWAIIAIIILCNILLFQKLFSKVGAYSDKMSSIQKNKYELDDI
jgi:membrane protein insertase Oxa1/YidC/SpoIIIJ